MAYFSHDGAGNRTVQAKGVISDVITRLGIEDHPVLSLLRREKTTDAQPKAPEDTLSAVNTSNFFAEDADAPAASDTARTLNDNWCQLFMTTAEVSDTQNAIAQYGFGKELVYQEGKKMIEIMRDAEKFIISDQVKQAPTAANTRTAKMAGMTTLMSSNTISTLSQANWDGLMTTIVQAGGRPTQAFMDATTLAAIGNWTTQYTRFSTDTKNFDQSIKSYQSDLGPAVQLNWHHLMPSDIVSAGAHSMIIDPSKWVIKELLALTRKSLPDNGAGPSTVLKWQLAVLCLAEAGNGYSTA